MLRKIEKNAYRVIDANLNRAKEGLRVCEEIFRFAFPNRTLSGRFKKIRHDVSNALDHTFLNKSELLNSRNSKGDIGKSSSILELKRNDFRDIFFANIQRSKESLRVLEEFCKLINKKRLAKIKSLRYELYDAEKKAARKFKTLYNS